MGTNFSRRTVFFILLGISLLSLTLQLSIILIPEQSLWGPDGGTYVGIANAIGEPLDIFRSDLGDGGYWAIGYPIFLSLVGLLPGDTTTSAVFIQSLLLIATSTAAFGVAAPLPMLLRVVTFSLVALSPSLLFASRVIGYESLLMFLLTIAIYFVMRIRKRLNGFILSALAAGFVLGLATWVQSKTLALMPVFVLALLVTRPFRDGFVKAGWLVAGYLSLTGLLAIRNGVSTGSFSPVTSNAAVNIHIGNSPGSSGRYEDVAFPPGWRETLSERVLTFALDQPREFVALQVRKMVELFVPTRERPDFGLMPLDLSLEALQMIWLAALALGLGLFVAGLALRALGRYSDFWPVAFIVVVGLSTHIPFIAEARMRIPYEPSLVILTVTAIAVLIRRWKSDSSDASVDNKMRNRSTD